MKEWLCRECGQRFHNPGEGLLRSYTLKRLTYHACFKKHKPRILREMKR